jgi:hypothetical protein
LNEGGQSTYVRFRYSSARPSIDTCLRLYVVSWNVSAVKRAATPRSSQSIQFLMIK